MPADNKAPPRTEALPHAPGLVWQAASVLVALLLGGALSVGMLLVSRNSEQRRTHDAFERTAGAFADRLETRVGDTIQLLDSLAGLAESSAGLSRAQFTLFSRHLFEHHDGIQAMEWVPRVPYDQRASHEREARVQGFPGYVISERGSADELVPAAEREEYYPVYYVEPLRGNEPAIGYDLASDRVRLAALTGAAEAGTVVSTGRIRLVQERGEQFGVLVAHPIYAGGSIPDSPEERRQAVQGFMVLVLRVGDLVDRSIVDLGAAGLRVMLYDESAEPGQRLLLSYPSDVAPTRLAPGAETEARHVRTLQVGSRTWRVVSEPLGGYLRAEETWLPWGLFASGLMGSLLLAGVVFFVSAGGRQARRHAAAITEANIALQGQMDKNARLLREARTFALLVEHSDDFVGVASPEGGVLFVNRAGRELVGLDADADLASLTIDEFLTDEGKRSSAEKEVPAVKSHGRWSGETTLRHFHTGESIPVSVNSFVIGDPETGQPAALATVQRDLRERERVLAAMYHAQKLESLGVLAGGIAHDFNNLLVAVLGNLDVARQSLPPASPAREPLESVEDASNRLAELSGQMLAYSGKGHFVVEPVDVSDLVGGMSRIVAASVTKKATIEYRLEPDLPAVEADATQVRQVFLNLIINASEALEDGTGCITVITGVRSCGREYLSSTYVDDDLPAGDYVFVEVTDTGSGMDDETLRRVFEPFFTTKFSGRGLGLAAALGIVRAHNGAVAVTSEPGAGTTFRVLIPASSSVSRRVEVEEVAEAWRGSGLVLLVDDEDVVREVAGRMLRALGFDVIDATDGRSAMRLFGIRRAEIVAVLLDRTMPVLDGPDTLREIRRIDAEVPVILSSGYSAEDHMGSQATDFVQKPYTLARLADVLRRALA